MRKSIKIVCLNLWLGGFLFDEILDFLQQEQPDVLLLQEVYESEDVALGRSYHSIETIQEVFHFLTADFALAMLDTDGDGNKFPQGNAVLSKFPLIKRDVLFFNEPYGERTERSEAAFRKTPRNLQHVQLDIDGTELNVFNFQGVWDLNGDNDSSERLQMSKVIVDAVMGKQNVILAGDTNVKPNTKTIKNIEKHLRNVFKDELTTSFNMRRKDNPGYATAVVDMLFLSSDVHVAEHHCPDLDISDHLPLIATLELTDK